MHIKTFTLEPSFNGFMTTGNFSLFSTDLIKFGFDLLNEYKIYFGVSIIIFYKKFFRNSLSIAIADEITPEWV